MTNDKCCYVTDYGHVHVKLVRDKNYEQRQELTLIPDPKNGWGISTTYPIKTEVTENLAINFAKTVRGFLGEQ